MTKDERHNQAWCPDTAWELWEERDCWGILLMKSGNFNLPPTPLERRIFLLFSGHLLSSIVHCGRSGNFFVLITNCSFSLWQRMEHSKVKMTMKRDFIELKNSRWCGEKFIFGDNFVTDKHDKWMLLLLSCRLRFQRRFWTFANISFDFVSAKRRKKAQTAETN